MTKKPAVRDLHESREVVPLHGKRPISIVSSEWSDLCNVSDAVSASGVRIRVRGSDVLVMAKGEVESESYLGVGKSANFLGIGRASDWKWIVAIIVGQLPITTRVAQMALDALPAEEV